MLILSATLFRFLKVLQVKLRKKVSLGRCWRSQPIVLIIKRKDSSRLYRSEWRTLKNYLMHLIINTSTSSCLSSRTWRKPPKKLWDNTGLTSILKARRVNLLKNKQCSPNWRARKKREIKNRDLTNLGWQGLLAILALVKLFKSMNKYSNSLKTWNLWFHLLH